MEKQGLGHIVKDFVLLGSWDEVQGVEAQALKKELEPETLNGLIIKGYEMKWDKVNSNREKYDPHAFDDFIKEYFVEGGLNMPVDINHQGSSDWKANCGRVLYIETNSVGFYFVVYVPREFEDYEQLKWRLKQGIIQGFSKEGFVRWEDEEPKYKTDGSFDYYLYKKMSVVSVSLVTTPANGLAFEQMKETKNRLHFENKIENNKAGTIAELFT